MMRAVSSVDDTEQSIHRPVGPKERAIGEAVIGFLGKSAALKQQQKCLVRCSFPAFTSAT